MPRIAAMCYLSETPSPLIEWANFALGPSIPSPDWGSEFCPMTTPKLASNVWIYAGCRCTFLAGNSSISLAGSEEHINFSQQSPKMLKMAPERFIHALLLLYRSPQNFPLGALNNSWVAREVTKNQTKKLSIFLRFYFHEVLQYLNTFT